MEESKNPSLTTKKLISLFSKCTCEILQKSAFSILYTNLCIPMRLNFSQLSAGFLSPKPTPIFKSLTLWIFSQKPTFQKNALDVVTFLDRFFCRCTVHKVKLSADILIRTKSPSDSLLANSRRAY